MGGAVGLGWGNRGLLLRLFFQEQKSILDVFYCALSFTMTTTTLRFTISNSNLNIQLQRLCATNIRWQDMNRYATLKFYFEMVKLLLRTKAAILFLNVPIGCLLRRRTRKHSAGQN